MSDPILYCPYCHRQAQWLPDNVVYQQGYGGYVYACLRCDAHIGCHKVGDHKQPKGTLASKELRRLRVQAHALFDPLWEAARKIRGWKKKEARNKAYCWLAREMGIPSEQCHIGMLRDDDVRRVIAICRGVYEKSRRMAA